MSTTTNQCFFEEIGSGLDGTIYETGCGNEVTAEQLPRFCQHCDAAVILSPGCRRCGSTEHTTGWHDAYLLKAETASKPTELQTVKGNELFDLLSKGERR